MSWLRLSYSISSWQASTQGGAQACVCWSPKWNAGDKQVGFWLICSVERHNESTYTLVSWWGILVPQGVRSDLLKAWSESCHCQFAHGNTVVEAKTKAVSRSLLSRIPQLSHEWTPITWYCSPWWSVNRPIAISHLFGLILHLLGCKSISSQPPVPSLSVLCAASVHAK